MRKIVLVSFAFFLAATTAVASSAAADRCRLPQSIGASEPIRAQIAVMIQRSATFRQQCQRLDIPRLSVQIRSDPQISEKSYRARTSISASATGRVAFVTIAAFGDPTEWLAHEFEHIIEQLDGVDLPRLAEASRRDAWCSGDNMFETARALLTGRLVLHEVKAAGRLLARALKLSAPDRAAAESVE